MLVLGRKPNQTILIGDNIKITILDMTRTTVKIGIEAPQDVRVLRSEILKRAPKGKSSAEENDKAPVAVLTVRAGRDHTAQPAVDPFDSNAVGNDVAGRLPAANDPQTVRAPSAKLGSMADRVRQLRSAGDVRIHPRLSAAV